MNVSAFNNLFCYYLIEVLLVFLFFILFLLFCLLYFINFLIGRFFFMDFIVSAINNLFKILIDCDILGMPLLVWFIIPVVLSLIISFLKGKKE